MNTTVKKLVLAAMFLALGLVLPFVTGQIPEIGQMLLPMHIPVMLCGFVCGWQYGLTVGFITPVLRSLLFGQPVIFPMAFAMAFELAAYGIVCGLLYKFLPKKKWIFYPELFISMIAGRIVYAFVMTILSGVTSSVKFGLLVWITTSLPSAVPGLILQIVLIPAIMIILQSAKLIPIEERQQQP